MKDSITCDTHGKTELVMACTHLQSSFPEELFVVPADEEWPIQAWCGICEEARLEDQGWYDAADAIA
jgi:hypothetical protein